MYCNILEVSIAILILPNLILRQIILKISANSISYHVGMIQKYKCILSVGLWPLNAQIYIAMVRQWLSPLTLYLDEVCSFLWDPDQTDITGHSRITQKKQIIASMQGAVQACHLLYLRQPSSYLLTIITYRLNGELLIIHRAHCIQNIKTERELCFLSSYPVINVKIQVYDWAPITSRRSSPIGFPP